jgi:hypothetical protein
MPEGRQQLPGTARPLVVHSINNFDTAILNYAQHQLEATEKDFELLRQATSGQQVQLEDTNDEVEGLRDMVFELQDELDGMNEKYELDAATRPFELPKSFMKETSTRAIIMGIIEGARPVESILSDPRIKP